MNPHPNRWLDISINNPCGDLGSHSAICMLVGVVVDLLESEAVGNTAAEYPAMKVTRSITIVKPDRSLSETPPASPASPASPVGSTTPVSPFAGETFRFRRKSALDAFEKASGIGSRSPRPPYEL